MKKLIYYSRRGLEIFTGTFIDTAVANLYYQIVEIAEHRVEIHKSMGTCKFRLTSS